MKPRALAALMLGPALVLAGCGRGSGAPNEIASQPKQPPNVVFILLDAVRADHLTPYGYAKNTTPFIASVADKSVVFDRAYAASTWTSSSMASIFTSLYVNQHGVLTGYLATKTALGRGESARLNRIPSSAETMPEVMKQLGYRTFGVADNLNICQRMGFDRGFDRFSPHSSQGSKVVNAQLREWRDEIGSGGKYFLYIHYMDAHKPYRKRKPWYDEKVPPEGRNMEAYDSNLSLMDSRIKEAFELLGLGKGETLVVITADHGEEFLDHGRNFHQNQLYNELLRVPLIVYYPGRLRSRRVADPVGTMDLLPTFREVAGGRPGRLDQGTSLLRTLAEPRQEPRLFFPMRVSEYGREPLAHKGVVRGKWKYIRTLPRRTEELYDMETDPKERDSVAGRFPAVVADLRGRLEEFEKTAKVYEREFSGETKISPEQAEQLKALGYVR